jgi:hypothetical protein
MANIRGYEAPQNLGLNPTEIGIDATAGAARRMGAYGNQIADTLSQEGKGVAGAAADAGAEAVDYMDHREISAGMAKSSEMWMNLTQAWENTKKTADPNDPSVAKKFIAEQVEPSLQQFQEGFSTEKSQQFAEQKVNALRQHFFESTSADMSTLAKIAVNKNINDSTTAMSNTAILDPSSVPALLKGMDHSVDGILSANPNISAIDAAKVRADVSEASKKAIVQAGAIGAIQKSGSPEATADQWIRKYPDYISGMEAKQLAGNARQQIRANNYDFETNRRRDKEVATDKSNEATNQYLIDVRSQDPKLANDPTAKKILNDPTLLKGDKNNLLNYIDRQLKPETQSQLSQQSFVGLLRDLRAPDADPDKVMQKAWDARLADPGKPGSMSEKDFNQFRQEVIARKTPEGAAIEHDRASFFHNYAPAITGNSLYDSKIGDPKMYNAEMDARRMEALLRSKGMDPHEAYDPASQYFLGKTERTAKWAGNMQQDLQMNASFKDRFGNLPPAQPAAPKPVPKVGDVRDGYEYLGGSPGAATSWKKAGEERS